MRLLRRGSVRDVCSVPVTRNTLVTWGERGYLREGDVLADPLRGTLTPFDLPEVAAAVTKSRWRTAAELAVAAALAGGAGLAVKTAGTAGAVASLPLLAAFQVWVRSRFSRRDDRLESLPTDAAGLAALEGRALRLELGPVARKGVGLLAVVAAFAVPAAVPVRLALGAVAALSARRWFTSFDA